MRTVATAAAASAHAALILLSVPAVRGAVGVVDAFAPPRHHRRPGYGERLTATASSASSLAFASGRRHAASPSGRASVGGVVTVGMVVSKPYFADDSGTKKTDDEEQEPQTQTSSPSSSSSQFNKQEFKSYEEGQPKSPSEFTLIKSALTQSTGSYTQIFEKFNDAGVSPDAIDTLVSKFERVVFKNGQEICRQGERGDYFYVIQEGRVKFYVDGKEVGTEGKGQTFGELALLYNNPRAATAVAFSNDDDDETKAGETTLWQVSRQTFREVLYSQPAPVVPKSPAEDEFIREALTHDTIFDALQLEPSEVDTLVGAFERHAVPRGKDVCVQGEKGDYYYIVESGEVQFTVDGTEVGTGGEAVSFGELALLFNTPRAATVTALADASLWRVNRHTFRSVLGGETLDNVNVYSQRVELKSKLQDATILGMLSAGADSSSAATADGEGDGKERDHFETAEDIMKQLEKIRPIARPAFHCSMNGDWCMVKADVNTMDMFLITTLSKMSQLFPSLLDFEDCFITLSDKATLVTCNIFVNLFPSLGKYPLKINAFTGLENDSTHPEGTLTYESFRGMKLLGLEFNAPFSVARPLEITYLDEDVMIARNDGGEPHLLIKIRACPKDDPDHKFTGFFEKARELYGGRITRCLVDRGFGEKKEHGEGGVGEADSLEKLLAANEKK